MSSPILFKGLTISKLKLVNILLIIDNASFTEFDLNIISPNITNIVVLKMLKHLTKTLLYLFLSYHKIY